MKKRLLSLILSIVLTVSAATVTAVPAAAARSETSAEIASTAAKDYPAIRSAAPSANGVLIRWSYFMGASQYFIFTKKSDGGWKLIGRSETTSFEHRFTANGASYTYTVRAADKDGNFISLADAEGYAYTCLPAPKPLSVVNTAKGQKLSWKSVKGAAYYKAYVKISGEWKELGVTSGTSYVNTAVKSGVRYTYTVRCLDSQAKTPNSYFDRKGVSATYVAAPKITSFKPIKGGTKLSWSASKGAVRYSVFIKSGSKWKFLTNTASTSYSHKKLTADRLYIYTVRATDSKGSFISAAAESASCRYLSPPEILSVVNGTLSWKANQYADGYRIYRRLFGKDWKSAKFTSATSYEDKVAPRDTLYSYTVRCLDENNKAISYFNDNSTWYYNGNPANGTITVNGSPLYFDNGKLRQGFVTLNGKTYYYDSKGVLQKNGLVGSKTEGWRYADKNGVINDSFTGVAKDLSGTLWYVKKGKVDRTLRAAVTVGGVDYDVIDGKAHKVSTEEERTLFRALKLADRVADKKLPKEKRLNILWDYIKGAYVEKNPRIPHFHGKNWHVIYANDMLVNGVGNCMSYGAELAFLAKAIGYDEVYACNSGGHGWAEIDGLVYDPEWSRHRFHYSYYALSYNAKTDQDYRGAISAGLWWMHVKVCGHL